MIRTRSRSDWMIAVAMVLVSGRIAGGDSLLIEESTFGSDPAELTVVGDYLYFSADDGISGRELWRIDRNGVVEQIQESWSGPGSLNPQLLKRAGNALYFQGVAEILLQQNANVKPSLVTVRGAEPYLQWPAVEAYLWAPEKTAPLDDGMAFFSRSAETGLELWYLDAEMDDARLLHEFVPGPNDGTLARFIVAHDDGVLVTGYFPEASEYLVLWYFADPDKPPVPLRDATGALIEDRGHFGYSAEIPDITYLALQSDTWSICRITGLDARVERVDLAPELSLMVSQLTAFDRGVYYQARTEPFGDEPYVWHDGEAAPRMLKDIAPGPASSGPFRFLNIGTYTLFIATAPEHGAELWRTEGTEESTRLVRDMLPGPRSAEAYSFCRWDDGMLFSCDRDEFGEELWYTDGTAEGTRLVKDINPGVPQSEPYYLTPFHDAVYFAAITTASGPEIWKTNGTPEGTVQVTSIRPPRRMVRSSKPESLTVLGEYVYFSATSPETGRELWRSDGLHNGTVCVADVNPGVASSSPRDLLVVDEQLQFVANGPDGQATYIWNPQGDVLTRAGDAALGTIAPNRTPSIEVTVGNYVCFTRWTVDHGEEPWARNTVTDEATFLLDIMPGPSSSSPRDWTAIGDRVYFRAQDTNGGTELWQTDGTPAGTLIVADFLPTPIGSIPRQIQPFRDGVVFLIRNLNNTQQILSIGPSGHAEWLSLWQQEHLKIHEVAGTGDRYFVTATHPAWGTELWCNNPTDFGIYLVRDIYPNTAFGK